MLLIGENKSLKILIFKKDRKSTILLTNPKKKYPSSIKNKSRKFIKCPPSLKIALKKKKKGFNKLSRF